MSDRSARVLFKAGKARDGYFTNEEIIAQAKLACDILDKRCGLPAESNQKNKLAYDNATNHRKRRENALSARHMPVNTPKADKPNFLCAIKGPDGNAVSVRMDDAKFEDGTTQYLYYPDGHPLAGRFKGMRQLLWERYERGTPGIPNPMEKKTPTSKVFKIKGECKSFRCPEGSTTCCLRRILFTQPDFSAVKSLLEEVCEARGYEVIFYPKFHCELNFIEQVWGYAKRLYREFPVSSSEDVLEANVVKAIDSVPIKSIRR